MDILDFVKRGPMRWQHCTSQSISSLATDSCRGYANCRDALRGAGLPSKRITLYEVRNVQISRISGVTAWPNVNTLRFQITKCQKLKMPQCQISTPMLQMPKSQNAKCQYLRINDPNAKISECQKNVKMSKIPKRLKCQKCQNGKTFLERP